MTSRLFFQLNFSVLFVRQISIYNIKFRTAHKTSNKRNQFFHFIVSFNFNVYKITDFFYSIVNEHKNLCSVINHIHNLNKNYKFSQSSPAFYNYNIRGVTIQGILKRRFS